MRIVIYLQSAYILRTPTYKYGIILHLTYYFPAIYWYLKASKISMSFVEWCEVVCPLQSDTHQLLTCYVVTLYRNIMLWLNC